jgi:hypothetical protein
LLRILINEKRSNIRFIFFLQLTTIFLLVIFILNYF